MWKDYLSESMKNNRVTSLSVRISAFIAALFLSLMCGLFYNMWKYEVERIKREEGGWQSRIFGELAQEDLESIRNFANIKNVMVNKKLNDGAEMVTDLYFDDYRAVLSDTPRIAGQIGVSPERVVYNYPLLAMYLIRSEKDTAPRMVFPMFLLVTAMSSLSLIVILYNSFAVCMNARTRQIGIFASIGATPKQIRSCLLQEAAFLCTVPVLAGNLLGIAGSMGLLRLSNLLLKDAVSKRHPAVFGYHPLILTLSLAVTLTTIWISAWIPARKLSVVPPLEAIRNTGELQLKRKKNSYALTRLFGVEGELAGNALKAQKKALRTASFSFLLSFMAFAIMQCFFSLSKISTQETYFEKYQDVWDLMVTIKDTGADAFEEAGAVRELAGVESAVVYQKAAAKRIVTEEEMSEEMKSFGGFSHASDKEVKKAYDGWLVNAPILILDDESFLAYCNEIGVTPGLDGAVILNQIRDVTNPDFRHPDFMPYIKVPGEGEQAESILRKPGSEEVTVKVPVLAYTKEVPALREEYATLDYYELVHFFPVSFWKKIKGQIGESGEDSYLCILGRKGVTLEELNTLQDGVERLIGGNDTVTYENRIQEYETNDKKIQGMMIELGVFCALLAMIGVGNVFSNTLGFVHQRKREFARYLSVGMTPKEIRKMFCIEAFVLVGRPVMITFPLTVFTVGYLLKLSYLEAGEFLAKAPFVPIMVFLLAMAGFVALAYYFAWRSVKKISLAKVLRDDAML